MVNSDTHSEICVSDLVRDPEDRTLSLENYLLLAEFDPEKHKLVKLPLIGRVMFPMLNKTPAPLANKDTYVKATIKNYWFGKNAFLGSNIYIEFQGESKRTLKTQNVRLVRETDETIITVPTREEVKVVKGTFRKPFKTSRRKEKGKELVNFYHSLFSSLKYQEVIFKARRNPKGYFIEAVQVPEELDYTAPEQGWVDL